MVVNRQVITLFLTVAVAVAPLQGLMANDSKMPGTHAIQSAQHDAPPSCVHHHDDTQSSVTHVLPEAEADETLPTVSSTPGCKCGDGYCACCSKVSVSVLPSIYTTVYISPQAEQIQTFSLFTGTFVLVKTRPPRLINSV